MATKIWKLQVYLSRDASVVGANIINNPIIVQSWTNHRWKYNAHVDPVQIVYEVLNVRKTFNLLRLNARRRGSRSVCRMVVSQSVSQSDCFNMLSTLASFRIRRRHSNINKHGNKPFNDITKAAAANKPYLVEDSTRSQKYYENGTKFLGQKNNKFCQT